VRRQSAAEIGLCPAASKSYHLPVKTKQKLYDMEKSAMAKTTCPITRGDFHAHAKPITIKIGEVPMQAEVKEFSTGSLGWYLNGKTSIEVGGKMVSVQIGMNLTIVGSKELPKE
jgi:hypothetical protein